MKSAPRREHGFLDQILGCITFRGQAAGDTEQASRVRHRDALEFILPCRHTLRYRFQKRLNGA
jgi:hypothetical protein